MLYDLNPENNNQYYITWSLKTFVEDVSVPQRQNFGGNWSLPAIQSEKVNAEVKLKGCMQTMI